MSKILSFIKNEPVVVLTGFINAGIEFAVQVGFKLSPDVRASILALSLAVVALLTRNVVTPTSSVPPTPAASQENTPGA